MMTRDEKFEQLLHHLRLMNTSGWELTYEAALGGDDESLVELAVFAKKLGLGHEVVSLLEEATAHECGAAFYELGNYFYEEAVAKEQLVKVLNFYERAAHLGHADAMNNLADMYLNGEGTTVDEKCAYHWFEQAAAQGVV